VKVLERYWWPTIVLIYPLASIFSLIPALHPFGMNAPRNILTVIALIGSALFEWAAHPELRLGDVRYLPRALWKHPVILVGFALAIWVVIASFVSADPAVALTGALNDGSDSAISYVALVGLMTFSYLNYQRSPRDIPILCDFVVASGIILAVLALFEVFTQRSIMFPGSIKVSDLPLVTFEGHGHLAGYLVLVFGGVITMWFKRNPNVLPVMILLVLAMSVSFNRASIIAAFLVTLLGWRTPKLVLVAMIIVAGGYFTGQKIIQLQQTGQTRAISDGTSGETRKYLWKAGLAGIASHPIAGYGGSLFAREWYKKLSMQELKTYLKLELGWDLVKLVSKSHQNPFFIAKDRGGKEILGGISKIKIHNQIIDFSIMWGIIGSLLYVLIVFFGVTNSFHLNYFSVSTLCIFLFSLTWFVSAQTEIFIFLFSALATQNSIKEY
jgi:O-Antigen ligase